MSIPTEKQVRNDKEAQTEQYVKALAKVIDNRLYERLGKNVEVLVNPSCGHQSRCPASFQVLGHVRWSRADFGTPPKSERVEAFGRHPVLSGWVLPSRSIITSAASRSAVPFAWKTSASTISPLRFSTNRFPL